MSRHHISVLHLGVESTQRRHKVAQRQTKVAQRRRKVAQRQAKVAQPWPEVAQPQPKANHFNNFRAFSVFAKCHLVIVRKKSSPFCFQIRAAN